MRLWILAALASCILTACAAGEMATASAWLPDPAAPSAGEINDMAFREPPADLTAILDAPPVPQGSVSADGEWLLLTQFAPWIDMDLLAGPRLAIGITQTPLDPRASRIQLLGLGIVTESFTIVRLSDGEVWSPDLPSELLVRPVWAPQGGILMFYDATPDGDELWVVDPQARNVHRLTGPDINAAMPRRMRPCVWAPDGERIVCLFDPANRGAPPEHDPTLRVENIRDTQIEGVSESANIGEPVARSDFQEAQAEYYYTSQPAVVDAVSGLIEHIGSPGMYLRIDASPDGNWYVAERMVRPYSRQSIPAGSAYVVEVWNSKGEVVRDLGVTPEMSGRTVAGDMRPDGIRQPRWRSDAPDALVFNEALDGGDLSRPAEYRDRLLQLTAPFTDEPVELLRTEGVITSASWASGGVGLIRERPVGSQESVEEAPATRTWRVDAGSVGDAPVEFDVAGGVISSRGEIVEDGDWIYLRSSGGVDRYNLETGARETLWTFDAERREQLVGLLDDEAHRVLTTAYDDVARPASYVLRDRETGEHSVVAEFNTPTPQMLDVQSYVVHYEREDGLALKGTLHLPPGYEDGDRLPVIVLGYPWARLTADKPAPTGDAPSMTRVEGLHPYGEGLSLSSTRGFMPMNAAHLCLLRGYAVFEADMPYVGETSNAAFDAYLEQIVADAEAGVAAIIELGVADLDRIGVMGHSFGGLMAANLIAHTDVFAAGVGSAGPYDYTRNIRAGTQGSERHLWEAVDTYVRMSPYFRPNLIDEPLLILSAEYDGVSYRHAEGLYSGINASGGAARMIVFNDEGHGELTREAGLHAAWETLQWFDCYVKRDMDSCERDDMPGWKAPWANDGE